MISESRFLGLKLHPLTFEKLLSQCEALISKRNGHLVGINAAKVLQAREEKALAQIINSSSLVHADGVSVVWGARSLGIKIPERLAGIDIMNELISRAPTKNWSVYLLGAEQHVLDKVEKIFRNSGVDIVGSRNGYWKADQEESIVKSIAERSPDLLFVAIPSPQKEYFVAQHLANLNCGLVVGVGGSFDVVAGETKRAPVFVQKIGMEWFYRLIQEPRRMFKRYAIGNTKFVGLVLAKWLTTRKRMISERSDKQ